MAFLSTRGICHDYPFDRCTDHAASPAHAAGYADAWLGIALRSRIICVTSGAFAAFLGRSSDATTTEDIRRFQLYQHENGIEPAMVNGSVSALRFLFAVTLKRRDLSRSLMITRYQR